jgi:hypothetical protein
MSDRIGRTWALDVHEVRVWRLHKSLELVPLLFGFLGRVEEIDSERLLPECQRTIGAVGMMGDAYHDCEESYRR